MLSRQGQKNEPETTDCTEMGAEGCYIHASEHRSHVFHGSSHERNFMGERDTELTLIDNGNEEYSIYSSISNPTGRSSN